MKSRGAGQPGGSVRVAALATVSGNSRGCSSGAGGIGGSAPRRAAGGGLDQAGPGPASITLPPGARLVHSGTLAAHDTSAGCGRGPASATHTNTVSGPTGGPPFGTFLIGRPTGTRPPNPGCS